MSSRATAQSNRSGDELDQEFVKHTYDSFLSEYPEEYAEYRWFGNPVGRYHYRQTRRVIAKVLSIKQYDTAVEVGGGDGVWTELFLPHVKVLDFLDISKEMVARAERRLAGKGSITFSVGDFLNNSLSDARYDCVLSVRNFEYYPDKERGVGEFARILKEGGELILVTKSPDFDWSGAVREKTLHKGQMSIGDLVLLLRRHGFAVRWVAPAIIGKKINIAPVAVVFDLLHRLIVASPIPIIPRAFTKYISESFLIHAIKQT